MMLLLLLLLLVVVVVRYPWLLVPSLLVLLLVVVLLLLFSRSSGPVPALASRVALLPVAPAVGKAQTGLGPAGEPSGHL